VTLTGLRVKQQPNQFYQLYYSHSQKEDKNEKKENLVFQFSFIVLASYRKNNFQ